MFKANTDITFGLSLVNKSNDDIEAGTYFDYCDDYQKDDFLLIYKMIGDDDSEEKWIPYGKPYQQPAPFRTIPARVVVPAGGEAKIHGRAWNSNPDNQPLTAGKYYTVPSEEGKFGIGRRFPL